MKCALNLYRHASFDKKIRKRYSDSIHKKNSIINTYLKNTRCLCVHRYNNHYQIVSRPEISIETIIRSWTPLVWLSVSRHVHVIPIIPLLYFVWFDDNVINSWLMYERCRCYEFTLLKIIRRYTPNSILNAHVHNDRIIYIYYTGDKMMTPTHHIRV